MLIPTSNLLCPYYGYPPFLHIRTSNFISWQNTVQHCLEIGISSFFYRHDCKPDIPISKLELVSYKSFEFQIGPDYCDGFVRRHPSLEVCRVPLKELFHAPKPGGAHILASMCSIFDGGISLKLHLHYHSSNLTTNNEDDVNDWCYVYSYIAHLLAYVAVIALLVVIVLTILRYLDELDDGNSEDQAHITETEPLLSGKYGQCRYGTCEGEDEDEETGSCSSSSSEELYDGKICVICYDEERNCFFVPCGHCATCYNCAQRIFEENCKICPVCRRPIRKVRKWFNP